MIRWPHCFAWTDELFRNIARVACRSILDIAEGKRPHGPPNPEVWDHPEFSRKMGFG